ncbi:hypothetical protein AAVH_38369, partial [Aphelenchoides avenae]
MSRLAAFFRTFVSLAALVHGAALPRHTRADLRRDGSAGNPRGQPAVTVPLKVAGSPTTNIFWTFDVIIG